MLIHTESNVRIASSSIIKFYRKYHLCMYNYIKDTHYFLFKYISSYFFMRQK